MCPIFSIFVLLVIVPLDLSHVSAVPILEFKETDFDHIFVSDVEVENVFESEFMFSKIDPNIAEDARLDTVFNELFYIFKAFNNHIPKL